MAKLDSILTFTGKLGNIIAYRRGGRHCLRSRPETVRQTAGTRRAAKWFGAASRKGALIRSAIIPDLDIHCDGSLVNRLNSAIVQAGRNNHAGLAGFPFNPYTGIEKFFPHLPTFSKNGQLRIPAQVLQAHGGACRMEVKLIATRINFATRHVTGTDVALLCIDLTQPFAGADMTVNAPGEGTLLVTLQVRMLLEAGASCNRKYKAADILAVVEYHTPEATGTKAQSREKRYHPLPVQSRKATPAANGQAIIQRE